MKKILKVLQSIILFMLLFVVTNLYVSADEIKEDSGEMNYDVIFVIDGSGSMKQSDPGKIAAEATKLFVDMCDQDTCRAGYVVYSHKIVEEQKLVKLNSEKSLKKFKTNISKIEYEPSADTDIALGLTKALQIFREDGLESGRTPMIVLLSDGNTDLPKGPRSVEESEKELATTMDTLASMQIPVYTIGLNYDGTLDVKNMENIAKKTGGKAYSTNTASDLPDIINAIFADFNKISIVPCPVVWDDGDYVATISIDNNSVCLANVVVLSEKGVSNPRLYTPGGTEISSGSSQVKMSASSSYTLVKLIFPEVGQWTLRIKGYEGDNISVSLLNSYSLSVQQKLDKTDVQVGDTVSIVAGLFDGSSDSPVNDPDLMAEMKASCTVLDETGTVVEILQLQENEDGYFTGSYAIGRYGAYQFQTTFTAGDGSFQKVSGKSVLNAANMLENVEVKQTLGQEQAFVGDTVSVNAGLYNGYATEALNGENLLESLSGICIVSDENGAIIQEISMKKNESGVFSADFQAEKNGIYTFTSIIRNSDGSFEKSSAQAVVKINKLLVTLLGKDTIRLEVRSNPLSSSEEIDLGRYAKWDPDYNLKISYDDNELKNIKVSVNQANGGAIIKVEGVDAGEDKFVVNLSDTEGGSVDLNIEVVITSGWALIFKILGLVFLVLLMIFLIYLLVRPKLKEELELSIIVPQGGPVSQPAKQTVALPIKRHTCSLNAAIQYSGNAEYALRNCIVKLELDKIIKEIKLTAMGKNRVKLTIPKGNGFNYFINGQEHEKVCNVILTRGGANCDISDQNKNVHIIISCAGQDKQEDIGSGFVGGFGGTAGSGNADGFGSVTGTGIGGGFGGSVGSGNVDGFGSGTGFGTNGGFGDSAGSDTGFGASGGFGEPEGSGNTGGFGGSAGSDTGFGTSGDFDSGFDNFDFFNDNGYDQNDNHNSGTGGFDGFGGF